jgi:hypothetical protein
MASGAVRQEGKAKMKQSYVAAEALPRKSLEQVAVVPRTLHATYAGKSATLEELCSTMGIRPGAGNTNYLFAGALAYGLVTKSGDEYTLAETGRKIVAPTYDGEDAEAKVKAVLTPTILSRFFTEYNAHTIPSDVHLPNVLETRFGVPRNRVTETIQLIVANGTYAGILHQQDGGGQPVVRLPGAGAAPVLAAATAQAEEAPADTGEEDESDWSKLCFYITPIGDEATDIRKHSDMLLKHLVQPAAEALGLRVVRADKIEKSGLITKQIFEHLVYSRLCIADLSFSNPNAFYELGVRHMVKRPCIQLIRKGDRIPFDVSQGRTIIVDTSDVYTIMDRIDSARREVAEHIKALLEGDNAGPSEDNRVETYLPGLRVTMLS